MPVDKKEQVIETATQIFIRYGFKRATMADLAEAAQMSRPELYLIFASKEEVFIAVKERFFATKLEEVRAGIDTLETVEAKLLFAFEIWNVRNLELLQTSPNARDLIKNKLEFAAGTAQKAADEFESIIVQILEPLMPPQPSLSLPTPQLAYILISAIGGLKSAAQSPSQLRKSIAELVDLVIDDYQD
jgi:AcrR family transcriptional regulator